MFNSISWSDFFTAAVLVIGSYYTIATLLLYNREIIEFCRSGFKRTVIAPLVEPRIQRHAVMGEARTNDLELIQERKAERSGREIIIAGDDEEPESISPLGTAAREALNTVVEHLQTEIVTVVQLAVECNSDKDETKSLVNALLIRYGDVRDSVLRPSVNQFITDEVNANLPFDVEPEEVDTWWND
jgi:hypothetical protein